MAYTLQQRYDDIVTCNGARATEISTSLTFVQRTGTSSSQTGYYRIINPNASTPNDPDPLNNFAYHTIPSTYKFIPVCSSDFTVKLNGNLGTVTVTAGSSETRIDTTGYVIPGFGSSIETTISSGSQTKLLRASVVGTGDGNNKGFTVSGSKTSVTIECGNSGFEVSYYNNNLNPIDTISGNNTTIKADTGTVITISKKAVDVTRYYHKATITAYLNIANGLRGKTLLMGIIESGDIVGFDFVDSSAGAYTSNITNGTGSVKYSWYNFHPSNSSYACTIYLIFASDSIITDASRLRNSIINTLSFAFVVAQGTNYYTDYYTGYLGIDGNSYGGQYGDIQNQSYYLNGSNEIYDDSSYFSWMPCRTFVDDNHMYVPPVSSTSYTSSTSIPAHSSITNNTNIRFGVDYYSV